MARLIDVPANLKRMRKVLSQEKTQDDPKDRDLAHVRSLLEDDKWRFQAMYAKEESDYRKRSDEVRKQKKGDVKTGKKDVGSERALGLVDQLLSEMGL